MKLRTYPGSPPRAVPWRGFVIPFTAVCMTLLIGMVALAVDLGMISVARTQVQHVADMAALSGARTLNGDSTNSNNASNVRPTVDNVTVDTSTTVLQQGLTTSQVAVQIRPYVFDPTLNRFPIPSDFPAPGGNSGSGPSETRTVTTGMTVPGNSYGWSMVRVTVGQSPASSGVTNNTAFGRVFGMNQFDVKAVATAVHRPRDVALILDFSGSMQYSSQFYFDTNNNPPCTRAQFDDIDPTTNNPNTPNWAYYNQVANYQSAMRRSTPSTSSSGEQFGVANITTDEPGGPPIIKDFYYKDAMGAYQNAFERGTAVSYSTTVMPQTPAPNNFRNQTDTPVAYNGDKWPRKNNNPGNTWAQTVQDFLTGSNAALTNDHPADTTFEGNGYGAGFKGYSMGAGYYGKTFYIWPPDPRPANDWRKKFFVNGSGTTAPNTPGAPLDDNSLLWNSNGTMKAPSNTTWRINYNAIMTWINSDPKVFPPNLRSGRVVYYKSIPATIRGSIANGGNAVSATDDASMDELFWKRYIDFVLGARGTPANYLVSTPPTSDNWGTVKITAKNSLTANPKPYMHYNDNPLHPRMHFWFGPLTMVAFIDTNDDTTGSHSGNWWPGTCHEAQCWQLKAGINAALSDIEKNHPNDQATLIFFSGIATYATSRESMSRNYARMKNYLWYPYSIVKNNLLGNTANEVRPFTASFGDAARGEVPNAAGSTCPEMALKVAYNEYSIRSATNPGPFVGRKGAQKMIVLETDGVPNTICGPTSGNTDDTTFTNNGAYASYYNGFTTLTGLGNGNSTVIARTKYVAQRLCAPTTNNPSNPYNAQRPGYSEPRLPVKLHCIAFGDLFEPGVTTSMKSQALTFLNDLEIIAEKVRDPSFTRAALPTWKVITGNANQRIEGIRFALESIMQSGQPIALIE
jgi:Flp pilus assembly protein TadG